MADLRGPVLLAVVVAAVGFGLIALAVRWLAGPVFAHELRVIARKGQQPRLRVGLAAVLLVVLFVSYLNAFGWDAVTGRPPTIDPRTGRFAERFAVCVLAVQLLAVVVLAPAVVGAAVAEDRARGTFDLLRTTALTDREIVVGKLFARLAAVAAVAAAGLPVLALTLLFGGVDPGLLLRVTAITAVAGFGLGAVSLRLGLTRDGLRGVLTTVYSITLGLSVFGSCCFVIPGVGGLSPVTLAGLELFRDDLQTGGVGPTSFALPASEIAFTAVYGLGGLLCVAASVGRVRTPVRRVYNAGASAVRRGFYVRPLRDGHPLVWREREFVNRRFGGFLSAGCGAGLLFLVGGGLFVGLARSLDQRVWLADSVAAVARPTLAAAAAFLPLLLGVRLAGTVTGERERQTWEALLMLPGDRRDLLRAKLRAAVEWQVWPLAVVGGLVLLAVLVGGIGPVGGLAGLLVLAGNAAFAVGLAGWLTVTRPTTNRATVWLLLWLLGLHAGPLLVSGLALYEVWFVSPVPAAWVATGGGWEGLAAVVPAALIGGAGAGLWRRAEAAV